MKSHPADLWKEPIPVPVFELVRARGMETIHHKRPGEHAAVCGLLPAESAHGRWTLYGALPNGCRWCEPCVIGCGKNMKEHGVDAETIAAWVAGFFPKDNK